MKNIKLSKDNSIDKLKEQIFNDILKKNNDILKKNNISKNNELYNQLQWLTGC